MLLPWQWLLTPLTSGTVCVCASQCVWECWCKPLCPLFFSHVWGPVCVLILRFVAYICTCVYVSVHMHVTTPAWMRVKVWNVCVCVCVLTCFGHKLSLLPVALGWSCGAQCVCFDAGSGEKIRAQDGSPKTHTHTQCCSKLMMTPSRPPAPSALPRPQELPCQLPDYKEPKHSAEGGNSSWWQPSIVATP